MTHNIVSPLATILLGGLAFFVTMFMMLKMVHFEGITVPTPAPLPAEDNPSWKFHNPEFEQWVAQIKEERATLAVKEEQLKEWENRLSAESGEINAVTQSVAKLQKDLEKRILEFSDQQAINAKKQLKLMSGMTPDGAMAVLSQYSDDEAVKILYLMKTDVSGPILDAMTKAGPSMTKRASDLSKRLKDVVPTAGTNTPTANATP